jgi:NAD(P)-dependent dehydrogenase (short-subunit alcohol dehydrogenase family)
VAHPVLEAGNVAVLTGAASGIGLGVAKRLAERGLKVAIADVNDEKLSASRDTLAALSANGDEDVLARRVDVRSVEDLESLRDEVLDRFGRVDLLMNNAAAFRFAGTSGDPQAWRDTFETNVLGITNGIHVFYAKMLEQARPGLIINTGSKQGITNPPGVAVYNAAKAAVKSLTESLAHELRSLEGCQLSAHLLVPGWTTTGDREHQPGAWLPEQVADFLLAGIERGDFYVICPDSETTWEMDRKRILWGAMDMTEQRPPLSRWHADWKAAFDVFEPPESN